MHTNLNGSWFSPLFFHEFSLFLGDKSDVPFLLTYLPTLSHCVRFCLRYLPTQKSDILYERSQTHDFGRSLDSCGTGLKEVEWFVVVMLRPSTSRRSKQNLKDKWQIFQFQPFFAIYHEIIAPRYWWVIEWIHHISTIVKNCILPLHTFYISKP